MRIRRLLIRLSLGLVLLYLIGGFLLLPIALKLAVPHFGSKSVAGDVKLGWAWVNPLTFSVTLKGLGIDAPDGSRVITLDRVHANADPIGSLFQGELRAREFSLHGALVDALIREDGSINLLEALEPVAPAEEPEEPDEESAGLPSAWLGLLSVQDVTIHLVDRSRPRPFEKTISPIGFEARDLRTAPNAETGYLFTATTAEEESFRLEGTAQIDPLSVRGTLAVRDIRMSGYAPLLGDTVELDLIDGTVGLTLNYEFALGPPLVARLTESSFTLDDADLRVREGTEPARMAIRQFAINDIELDASIPEEGTPAVRLGANLSLDGFSARTEQPEESFMDFERFAIEGLTVEMEPLRVRSDVIRLTAPSALIRRLADGELALLKLLPPSPESAEPTEEVADAEEPPAEPEGEAPAPAEPSLDIEIAQVILESGSVRLLDASVEPLADVRVTPVNLELTNVTLEPGAETLAKFSAVVQEQGDFALEARTSLSDPSVSSAGTAQIQLIPLSAFSAYAAQAIGRPIDEGALAADFDISVENNQLNGENVLRVKTLRFGDQVPGYEGASYPVGTAIAVLENSDGEIVLEIPLAGDLDNPDFKPLKIIGDILRSTMTKAITAPFRLAVSLPGKIIPGLSVLGGGENDADYSRCPFPAGSATLSDEGREVLDRIAEMLDNRPGVTLRLQGSVAPGEDAAALAQARLEEKLATIEGANSRTERLRQLFAREFDLATAEPTATPTPPDESVPAPTNEPEPEAVPEPEPAAESSPSPGFYLSSTETTAEPATPVQSFYLRPGSKRSAVMRPVVKVERPAPEPEAETAPTAPDPASETTPTTETAQTDASQPTPTPTRDAPAASLSPSEMETRLLARYGAKPEDLAALANTRVDAVRSYLTEEVGLTANRLSTTDDSPSREGAQVTFELQSNLR